MLHTSFHLDLSFIRELIHSCVFPELLYLYFTQSINTETYCMAFGDLNIVCGYISGQCIGLILQAGLRGSKIFQVQRILMLPCFSQKAIEQNGNSNV